MSDEQHPLDQLLEDVELASRSASLAFNDPFMLFETAATIASAQRDLLFGEREE